MIEASLRGSLVDTIEKPQGSGETYKSKRIPTEMEKAKAQHERELLQKEADAARKKFLNYLRVGTVDHRGYPIQTILVFLILNLDRETPAQILKRRMALQEESENKRINKIIDYVETERNNFINALERDDRWQLEHMFFEIFGTKIDSILTDDMKKFRDKGLYDALKRQLIKKINDTFEQLAREYENQRI